MRRAAGSSEIKLSTEEVGDSTRYVFARALAVTFAFTPMYPRGGEKTVFGGGAGGFWIGLS